MMLEGIGLPKDEKLALSWFKTAARAHDADAINMVGDATRTDGSRA